MAALGSNSVPIPQFSDGAVVIHHDDPDYFLYAYQYGTSSASKRRRETKPRFILYPTGDEDVKLAIKYAQEAKCSMAVRTGGHQYCAASSTTGLNFQLDLSKTYKEFEVGGTPEKPTVRIGVSYALKDLNFKLGQQELFVPHGQCGYVHVGGHAQTGGFGQCGRSFGLFADHIESFTFFVASADPANMKREVRRNADSEEERELFHSVLGGSPGNFGVLTHVTLRAHRSKDHPHSRGLKAAFLYRKDTLENMLRVFVEMSENSDLAGDLDFCITVMSASDKFLPAIYLGLDAEMLRGNKDFFGPDNQSFWPPVIVVYVQWANLGGAGAPWEKQAEAQQWFKRIREAGGTPIVQGPTEADPTPMHKLTEAWIFQNHREFDLPYVKRAWMAGEDLKLSTTGWAEWCAGRIDDIQSHFNGCHLSIQIQNFGGKNSAYRKNAMDDSIAVSWRKDTTVCCVMDCFFNSRGFFSGSSRDTAIKWQRGNLAEGILNPKPKFATKERRFLWASWGEPLDDVHQLYYDDEKAYQRLLKAKLRFDPKGVFSPNDFCIGYRQTAPTHPAPAHPHAMLAVTAAAVAAPAPQPAVVAAPAPQPAVRAPRVPSLFHILASPPPIPQGPAHPAHPAQPARLAAPPPHAAFAVAPAALGAVHAGAGDADDEVQETEEYTFDDAALSHVAQAVAPFDLRTFKTWRSAHRDAFIQLNAI